MHLNHHQEKLLISALLCVLRMILNDAGFYVFFTVFRLAAGFQSDWVFTARTWSATGEPHGSWRGGVEECTNLLPVIRNLCRATHVWMCAHEYTHANEHLQVGAWPLAHEPPPVNLCRSNTHILTRLMKSKLQCNDALTHSPPSRISSLCCCD